MGVGGKIMMSLSSVPCGPSVVACLILYLLRRPTAVPALNKPAAPALNKPAAPALEPAAPALKAVPELKPAAPAQPQKRPSEGPTEQQAASKPKKKWGGGT